MSKKVFKIIGEVAAVVGAVALVASGIGAALGGTMMLTVFGTSIAASSIAAAAGLIGAGASLLSKPKAPKLSQASQDRLTVSLDPRSPRKTVFGRTAMATDLRDQEFSGANKDYLHRFVVVAAHKVHSVQEIWFDDQLAWSSAGGVASTYAGYLTVTAVLEGAPGNAINLGPRMGASRRFTGCAYVYFRFKLTGNSKKVTSPFASQVPTRMTIIGEGIACYDPRQDGTQPGGSGAHRADDQTTWTYGTHARNPACQLATWMLGWRIQNPQSLTWKLSVGCGTPPARIDWPAVIEAANLCDEAVTLAVGGTEPRYRGDGLFDESEGDVIETLAACMNADIDDQDGLIRPMVFHNDLAAIDADFTEADVENDYQWRQTRPLHESFNVVRGSWIDPTSPALYQPSEYPEVRVASLDGIDRIHPADFRHVQSKSQAERLAKQRLQRQLYGGTFQATFLASGWKVQKNSVVRFNFAPEGFVDKLFRVSEYEGARPDGRVPMTLVEEDAQIYAWDAEESPAVELAEPTLYAPGDTPIAQFLGTMDEGATRNVPAQLLQDGVFLDQYWSRDGLARAFAYAPAPSGYALEIPYNGNVDSFSGYGGVADLYMEIHPGKRLWVRFVCDPAGKMLVDLFDGDEPLYDGDEPLVDAEYPNANWLLKAQMAWFQADGTPISTTALISVDPALGNQTIVVSAAPPPLARRARLLFGHSAQLGVEGSWAVWSPWVGEHQPSADVTGENAPTMVLSPDQVIQAISDGTVKDGQLGAPLVNRRYLGGVDVSADANWSAVFVGLGVEGVDVLIDNAAGSPTRGAITPSVMPGNSASATVTSTYDGVELEDVILFAKQIAAPDVGGSGGAGSTTVTADVSGTVTATGYGTVYAQVTIPVTAGQTLRVSAPLGYTVHSGTATLAGKAQYAVSGSGSWSDIDAEVVSDMPASYSGALFNEAGYLQLIQSIPGLAAGDYDVRILLRRSSGSTAAYPTGTATIKAE